MQYYIIIIIITLKFVVFTIFRNSVKKIASGAAMSTNFPIFVCNEFRIMLLGVRQRILNGQPGLVAAPVLVAEIVKPWCTNQC